MQRFAPSRMRLATAGPLFTNCTLRRCNASPYVTSNTSAGNVSISGHEPADDVAAWFDPSYYDARARFVYGPVTYTLAR